MYGFKIVVSEKLTITLVEGGDEVDVSTTHYKGKQNVVFALPETKQGVLSDFCRKHGSASLKIDASYVDYSNGGDRVVKSVIFTNNDDNSVVVEMIESLNGVDAISVDKIKIEKGDVFRMRLLHDIRAEG